MRLAEDSDGSPGRVNDPELVRGFGVRDANTGPAWKISPNSPEGFTGAHPVKHNNMQAIMRSFVYK